MNYKLHNIIPPDSSVTYCNNHAISIYKLIFYLFDNPTKSTSLHIKPNTCTYLFSNTVI